MFRLDKNQACSDLFMCAYTYCVPQIPSSLQALTNILKEGREKKKKPSQVNLGSEVGKKILVRGLDS